MTMPMPPVNTGYRTMPGGYDANAARQGLPPATPPGMQPQGQLPAPGFPPLPPGMSLGPQEGFSPDALPLPPRPVPGVPLVPPAGLPQNPQQQQQQYQQPQQPQPQAYPTQPGQLPPGFVHGPQQPQPPQAPAGVDPNARLYGPGIPANLQGRTIGEAMQIYNGMQNVIMQQMNAPQPAPAAPAPAAPAAPQGNGTQPQGDGWDWRNPTASVKSAAAAAVQEVLAPMLAPVVAQSNMAGIQNARNVAAQTVGPAFAQVEPLVLQRLQGADPRTLSNPEIWKIAAHSVIGELVSRGQMPQVAAPQLPQLPQAPAGYPPQRQGQPLPNLGSFFTEQPNMGAPTQAPQTLSPTQSWVARQMGMSDADFIAWGGLAQAGAR